MIGYKIIKEVFKKHEKTIILEDDCVPEVGFFRYCDLMLKKFKRNKDIAHISGCNLYYGSKKKKINDKDYFFLLNTLNSWVGQRGETDGKNIMILI